MPFDFQCRAIGLPPPVGEYRFHPVRRWRFDYAWKLPTMVALEVQGGIWTGGKHGRGSGIVKDYEKLNHAQANGWTVLQLTPQQVKAGELTQWLRKLAA